jgi:hypothetical protein
MVASSPESCRLTRLIPVQAEWLFQDPSRGEALESIRGEQRLPFLYELPVPNEKLDPGHRHGYSALCQTPVDLGQGWAEGVGSVLIPFPQHPGIPQ